MPFSDIISHPVFDSVSGIMDSAEFLTLICSVLFPLLAAICIFICLHAAPLRRKLLCFFLGMPLYVIPTAFLLTDVENTARAITAGGDVPLISDSIGFLAAVALGIVYLGVTVLVCSEGITKQGGRLLTFFSTVIFFCLSILLCYFSLLALTDTEFEPTIAVVFPAAEGLAYIQTFAGFSVHYAAVPLLSLFIILLFITFFFDKNRDELRREDIERLHRIEAEAARIEKEGVCAVCRYADLPETGRGNIFCEKKGSMPPDARCPHFEYDPLKRIPEKHVSAEKEGAGTER